MPRWDAQGNPIADAPPPQMRWDASGNPITVTSPGQSEAEVNQRHARGTLPSVNKWASENPQAAEESRQGIYRGAGNALDDLTQGAIGMGKQVLFPKGNTEG